MANINAPFGFEPVRHAKGGVIRNNNLGEYQLAANYGSNVFTGDVLRFATTGFVEVATAADTNLIGVFAGVEYIHPDGEIIFRSYWPASQATMVNTVIRVHVLDDPDVIYRVRTVNATMTRAMIGANAPLSAATPGSTLTGRSGMALDLTTPVATTAQFRIINFAPELDNDFTSINSVAEVMFVQTLLRPAGTIGI
jgi:hypothetical protein